MGHDARFNNHHWGKGGGKVTFEFDAAGIDLDKIAASGQCFRWTPAPEVPGGYIVPTAGLCGTVYTIGNRLYIREHTIPDHNNLNPTAIAARGWWGRYLDMGTDYRSRRTDILYWASREPDGYLARAARAGEGMRILNQEPFEALVSFIVSQNNNIPRIKRIIENLCRHLGKRHFAPTARGNFPGAEWWDFPEPAALADESRLRDLGLGYRLPYVVAAARAVASGALDLEALKLTAYERARARLKELPGVGDKVADCVCLYGLNHGEAFLVDVHIRRVLEREFPSGFQTNHFPGFAGYVQQLIFYHEQTNGTPAGE